MPYAQCDTRWPPHASPSCCFGLQTAARVFFLCAESEAQAEDFQVAVSLAAASNSGGDATAARHALAQLQALIESSVPIACRFSEVSGNVVSFLNMGSVSSDGRPSARAPSFSSHVFHSLSFLLLPALHTVMCAPGFAKIPRPTLAHLHLAHDHMNASESRFCGASKRSAARL